MRRVAHLVLLFLVGSGMCLQTLPVYADGGPLAEAQAFSKRLLQAVDTYEAGDPTAASREVGRIFAEFEASEIHVRLASKDETAYRWLMACDFLV